MPVRYDVVRLYVVVAETWSPPLAEVFLDTPNFKKLDERREGGASSLERYV